MAAVDLSDEHLTNINGQKQSAIDMINQNYDNQIAQSDDYYNRQIDSVKEYANKQTELQQAQSDYAIKQIETQKEDTSKDYNKEQKAAYADYMKQNNAYGYSGNAVNRGSMAGSGAAASIQASYYNSYQQRYATARESYDKAIRDYNSSITQAQLQNNATLAEIAYKAQEQSLQLAQSAYQYKNELLNQKTSSLLQTTEHYDSLWQQMYNALLSEAQRKEQMDLAWKEYELKMKQLEEEERYHREQADIARKQASSYNYSFSDTSNNNTTTSTPVASSTKKTTTKSSSKNKTTKVSSKETNWLNGVLNALGSAIGSMFGGGSR